MIHRVFRLSSQKKSIKVFIRGSNKICCWKFVFESNKNSGKYWKKWQNYSKICKNVEIWLLFSAKKIKDNPNSLLFAVLNQNSLNILSSKKSAASCVPVLLNGITYTLMQPLLCLFHYFMFATLLLSLFFLPSEHCQRVTLDSLSKSIIKMRSFFSGYYKQK